MFKQTFVFPLVVSLRYSQRHIADEGLQAYATTSINYPLNVRGTQDCLGLLGFAKGGNGNMQWPELEAKLAGDPIASDRPTRAVC